LETNETKERITGADRLGAVQKFSSEARGLLGFYARSKATGEYFARTDRRRERNRDATVSEFVATISLEGGELISNC
jgi:hypothetical protein